ncbi:MAG: radical SAM protein [Candidatus Lokiarchaeota archaeon]|nr:radical SAM protein [Candidatus Lokiarchaeota archaeon]
MVKIFKVALVNPGPGEILEKGRIIANADHIYPPLGICYLSSVLKKENYHIDIVDQAAMGFNLTQIVEWIKKKDPDVLGFSTLTASGSGISAALTSIEVKKWNPNVKIVFGNRHVNHNDYRILNKYPEIDICVRGEGEFTFIELVKALEKDKSLEDIKGLTYRDNGIIKRTTDRPLNKDLDAIPFPDRKALNLEYTGSFGGLEFAPKGFTSMTSSRGCPYQCAFCYGKRTVGFRTRSVENILEEILFLESEGYKYINFVDDNFTVSKKRVIKLCRLMRKHKIDMDWICEGRVNQVSDDMLQEMRRANCRIMFYGVESANQRILDYYRKNITPSQSILAVKKTRRAKIPFILGSFIVGAPGETFSEVYNTLKFAQKLEIDFPVFNLLGTMPGTDIWDEMVEKNILDEDKYWEEGVHIPDIDPNGVPTEVISNLIFKMLRQFFMNPKYILKALYRSTTSYYKIMTVFNILAHNLKNFEDFHGLKSFWNPDNV